MLFEFARERVVLLNFASLRDVDRLGVAAVWFSFGSQELLREVVQFWNYSNSSEESIFSIGLIHFK